MRKFRIFILVFTVSLLAVSCHKESTKIVNKYVQLPSITLISPENGSVLPESTTSITLKWKYNGGNVKNFTFEVVGGTNISQLKTLANNLTDTQFTLNNLEKGETYYWQIKLHYKDAVTESTIFRFTIYSYTITPPTIPEAIYPENGAVVTDNKVTLLWKASRTYDGSSPTYSLYVGTNPENLYLIVTEEDITSYTLTNLVNHTKYYWKVVVEDKGGRKNETGLLEFSTNFKIKRFIDASFSYEDYSHPATNPYLNHGCAIDSQGQLWCWGVNSKGELGFGFTSNDFYYPFPGAIELPHKVGVPADLKFQKVSMGVETGCAIDENNDLWCWGDNSHGQLGSPGIEDFAYFPVIVTNSNNTGWLAISTYKYHTCGIDTDNLLWCWGENGDGQLGISNYTNQLKPVIVKSDIVSVGVGENFTCALDKYGKIYCWGSNQYGILANPAYDKINEPQSVNNPDGVAWTKLYVGYTHVCAIDEQEALWCWGNNKYGQLGTTPSEIVYIPAKISHPDNQPWKNVVLGYNTTCALDNQNTLWCWFPPPVTTMGVYQYNSYPAKVTTYNTGIKKLISGSTDICAIDITGKLSCMGIRDYGSFADGFYHGHVLPAEKVINPAHHKWKSVSTSVFNTCALDDQNIIWCWGRRETPIGRKIPYLGQYNEVPYINSAMLPYPVTTDTQLKFKELAHISLIVMANNNSQILYHRCALDVNNHIWCWGRNDHGQLGIGNLRNHYSPRMVTYPNDTTWESVSTGYFHTCAIDSEKNLWCWGWNQEDGYQLGITIPGEYVYPTQITYPPDKKWESVSAGAAFSCALDTDGKVYCWGDNSFQTISQDSSTNYYTYPVTVDWVSDKRFKEISAGGIHVCGITIDNDLYCWGNNDLNQSGGEEKTSPILQKVEVGNTTKWKKVTTNGLNTCALSMDDKLWCWGYDYHYSVGTEDKDDMISGQPEWEVGLPPMPVAFLPYPVISFSTSTTHSCAVTENGDLYCWGSSYYGETGTNFVPTFKTINW